MQPLSDFQQEIPSNKFYPPRLDRSNLLRSELISDKLGNVGLDAQVVVIEAQAGQGKSVLAAQLLDHFDLRFAWYQVGQEDADPVLLLAALTANFSRRLQGFSSPQLSRIMSTGEIGPLDFTRCINILLADLDAFLAGDFYLVFDDMHLIEDSPLAGALLTHLIDTAPPRLHFVLISRRPLTLQSKTLRFSSDVCYLDNDDLCLNSSEIEHLLLQTMNLDIGSRAAENLRTATGGWIMGILLAAHPAGGRSAQHSLLPDNLTAPQLLDYFRDEIFVHIPEELHLPLLQICFVKEIHIDLAQTITNRPDIGLQLTAMMQDNFFVYPLDDEQQIFRFHHLFQEFLQHRAQATLSAAEIDRINRTAAEYYLEQGAVEKALACYASRSDYSAMERVLQREGLELLAKNRTVTLLTLLTSVPEQKLLKHGWLTLFCGLVFADFQPAKSLPLLEAARKRFVILGEEIGELLAVAQTIYYHFVVSGLYHTGALLLPRTEELLRIHADDLPLNARIIVARNLAAGYCFFNSDMDQARRYAHMARDLALKHGIHNGISATRFICGYAESLTGRQQECLQEIELSYPLLYDPLVGMSNKLTLRVLQLNFLSKFGDILNFDHQQELLRKTIDTRIVKQTVAAPYLYVWGCACLVSIGRLDRAREILQQGMETAASAKIPHMRSQLLQWQGYLYALKGNSNRAIKALSEAGSLRKQSGGPFYEVVYEIMAGAAYIRIDMPNEADTLLASAIAKARQIPSDYLSAAALMHRSLLALRRQDTAAAKTDLLQALTLMRRNQYTFFWSWEPQFIRELLCFAFQQDLEKSFVSRLARQRLDMFFTRDGKPLPLLTVSILGPFQVSGGGKTTLQADDFTSAQRTLLSLLLTTPEQKMHQESIQAVLWPESSPDKARAKFDTLLTRMRRVLKDALAGPVTQYLVLRKGILRLKNCRIDAVEFEALARTGLKHAHAERYWQAGNAFYRAIALWTGPIETDGFMAGEAAQFMDRMTRLLTRITHTWAVSLAESDNLEEAVTILDKALRYDRMDDRLITLLYSLYLKSGNPLKAKETILNYRQILQDMEYNQEDVDEMLFQVASKAV